MNLVWDASRIWSVVFTVVWDASRIFFSFLPKKLTKTTKMRVCELQSIPIFLLITNACPHARIDCWRRSRAPITVSELSNRPITSLGRFLS
jgi:hypothetical protein